MRVNILKLENLSPAQRASILAHRAKMFGDATASVAADAAEKVAAEAPKADATEASQAAATETVKSAAAAPAAVAAAKTEERVKFNSEMPVTSGVMVAWGWLVDSVKAAYQWSVQKVCEVRDYIASTSVCQWVVEKSCAVGRMLRDALTSTHEWLGDTVPGYGWSAERLGEAFAKVKTWGKVGVAYTKSAVTFAADNVAYGLKCTGNIVDQAAMWTGGLFQGQKREYIPVHESGNAVVKVVSRDNNAVVAEHQLDRRIFALESPTWAEHQPTDIEAVQAGERVAQAVKTGVVAAKAAVVAGVAAASAVVAGQAAAETPQAVEPQVVVEARAVDAAAQYFVERFQQTQREVQPSFNGGEPVEVVTSEVGELQATQMRVGEVAKARTPDGGNMLIVATRLGAVAVWETTDGIEFAMSEELNASSALNMQFTVETAAQQLKEIFGDATTPNLGERIERLYAAFGSLPQA